jgi:hypothetical protein
MTFRDTEKKRYHDLKGTLFSAEAQEPGTYRGKPRPFCLADGHSPENLYEGFREDAITYFRERGITWHDGRPDEYGNGRGLPSNHLCCSQSACVNALWPMTQDPELLACVFRPFFPKLADALPIEADAPLPDGSKPYLAFEWIGTERYLGERARTRGANATSADFVFRFRRYDGRVHLVLGEWKYTEYYGRKTSPPKQVQLDTYRQMFKRWKAACPRLPNYQDFFAEPFYQLMRLTLLAQEMERARSQGAGEMGAEVVSVLVVAPKANREYRERFTVASFERFGRTVSKAWANLAPRDRFLSISTESLLTVIEQAAPEPLSDWRDHLLARYGWWRS